MEKKCATLSQWVDDVNEKLKKSQADRKETEMENESLRARVMILTDSTERLRSRIATLEEAQAGVAPVETPLSKRVTQLEDTLSTARDSLKRKREREKKLIREKETLEARLNTAVNEVSKYRVENEDLREKVVMALEGVAMADGLVATVAKAHNGPDFQVRRNDVVTVLSAEGEFARVAFNGVYGKIPVASLSCVGIPLLQYIDLVAPDRAEQQRMLDRWLDEAKSPVKAAPKRNVSKPDDGVLSIRLKVEELLHEIDESMSEPASPLQYSGQSSFAVTPRENVSSERSAELMEAFMASVDELSTSARHYNSILEKLTEEASPLMKSLSDEALLRVASLEHELAGARDTTKTMREENERLRADLEKVSQDLRENRSDVEKKLVAAQLAVLTANAECQRLQMELENASMQAQVDASVPEVEDLAKAELSFASRSTPQDEQVKSVEFLQMQMDLNDALAEKERLMIEVESLRVELTRLRSTEAELKEQVKQGRGVDESLHQEHERLKAVDATLLKERERSSLLEEKIVELSKKMERQVSQEDYLNERKKVETLEKRVADLEKSLSEKSKHAEESAKPVVALSALQTSSDTIKQVESSPGVGRRSTFQQLLKRGKRSQKKGSSIAPASQEEAYDAALAQARADLEALESKMKSPRLSIRSSDMDSERERLIAEIQALESMAKEPHTVQEPTISETDSEALAKLAAVSSRSSVRGSLNDSVIQESSELSSILSGVVVTSEETAERFAHDDTRFEEMQRRSKVLKSIPGIKVVEPEALKAKLAAAEERNAELAAEVDALQKNVTTLQAALDAITPRAGLNRSGLDESDLRSFSVPDDTLDLILGTRAAPQPQEDETKVKELTHQLTLAQRHFEEIQERERNHRRELDDKIRTLEFELATVSGLLEVEKETRARITEKEEATKMASRAEIAQLKKQKEDSDTKLASLQKDLDAANASVSQLQTLNKSLMVDLAALRASQTKASEQSSKESLERAAVLEKDKSERSSLEKKVTEVEGELKSARAAAAETSKQLEASRSANTELEGKVRKLETELSAATGNSVLLETRLVEATGVITQLRENNKKMDALLTKHMAAEKTLKEHTAQLEQRVKNLEEVNRKMEQRIVDNKTTIEKLSASNQESSAKLDGAKSLEQQNKDLTAALAAANEKILSLEPLESRIIEATTIITELNDTKTALEARVVEYARNEAVLRKQVAKVESQAKDIAQLEARVSEATVLISSLHEEKTEKDAALAAVLEKNKKLEATLAEEAKKVAQLREVNKLMESKLAKEKAEQQQQPQPKEASSQVDEVNKQLEVKLAGALKAAAAAGQNAERLEKDNEEIKTRYAKLLVTVKDLTTRYNEAKAELKTAATVQSQMKEQLQLQVQKNDALQRELAKQALKFEALERAMSPGGNVMSRGSAANPESPYKPPVKAVVEVERAAAPPSGEGELQDVLRRSAALDVRESRVESREALAESLKQARAQLTKAEEAEAGERRLRRDVEVQLSSAQMLVESKEKDKQAALERAKDAEARLLKQQQESQNMLSVMHTQVNQLLTEKAELKKALDKKLKDDKDAQQLASLEMRLRLASEQAVQSEQDFKQQLKFVQDDLASQRRLRETFEEVNSTLKASVDMLSAELDLLRQQVAAEHKTTETLRLERDAARDEADRASIDKNMYERISAKLQKRIGDEDSSEDEGKSKVELELRERIKALQETVAHENKRKHQMFETIEELRKQIKTQQQGDK